MDLRRILIIGNSGSGKSWLAERLGDACSVAPTDLDTIRWIGPGYRLRREAIAIVRQIAQAEQWIIEGVYGWLAQAALPRVTCLIWLDLPVEGCIANLTERGVRGGGDRASFSALLESTRDYEGRGAVRHARRTVILRKASAGMR
jgi:adenylate kinase family enzyme